MPLMVNHRLQLSVREQGSLLTSSFMRAATVTCVAQGVQQRQVNQAVHMSTKS